MGKYLEIIIMRIKPEHHMDYLKEIPAASVLAEKMGFHVIGRFMVEAGSEGPEVVFFQEWDTLAHRTKVHEAAMANKEWMSLYNKLTHMIIGWRTHMVTAAPGTDWDKLRGKKRMTLEGYRVNGGLTKAMETMKKFETKWFANSKAPGEMVLKTLTVFSPCPATMWLCYCAEDMDGTMGEWEKFMDKNTGLVDEMMTATSMNSCRLLGPIPKV
jgi:hypothetical protein